MPPPSPDPWDPHPDEEIPSPIGIDRRTTLRAGLGLSAAALATGTLAWWSRPSDPGTAPVVIDTDEWGAKAARGGLDTAYKRPRKLVVHHTETPNDRPSTRAAGIELAQIIQRHHLDQSWADTGQHFTVSRGGFVLEGRHGSLDAARSGRRFVIGAHAPGCNLDGIGIETEGTFTDTLPRRVQRQALVELVAWLCRQYRIPVSRIVGHRDCPESETSCPGDRFHQELPALRREVAARMG